jgi:hypothetical protein
MGKLQDRDSRNMRKQGNMIPQEVNSSSETKLKDTEMAEMLDKELRSRV